MPPLWDGDRLGRQVRKRDEWEMKKQRSFREKMRVLAAIDIAAFVPLGLALIADNRTLSILSFVWLVLLFAVDCILDSKWMRCPHCNSWLGHLLGVRRGYLQFCPRCGEELNWDAKSEE